MFSIGCNSIPFLHRCVRMKFLRSSLFVCFLLIALYVLLFTQGVVLTHNASARVIRSNQSLVLQRVTRHSAGNYSCSAINAEGETVSNQLELRVKCKYSHFQWPFYLFQIFIRLYFLHLSTICSSLALGAPYKIICSEIFL